jgi:ABC-2 type transport system permease protein
VRRALAVARRQLDLARGSVSRLVPLFAWVAVDIVLWGFFTRWLATVAGGGVPFVAVLLGAVLLWGFFARVMHGVTMAFLEDVWSRSFLHVFASPISIPEYVGGLVVSAAATSTIGLAVMLALATAAFGLDVGAYGLAVFPFLLVLFLFGIALGITGSAIVLRLGPAAEWFVWPIPALVSPLAGVFYPVSTLPAPLRAISRALPPSYVFEALRAIVRGEPAPWGALALGAGLAAVYVVVAASVFGAVFRGAVRSGLLARYSAESVS